MKQLVICFFNKKTQPSYYHPGLAFFVAGDTKKKPIIDASFKIPTYIYMRICTGSQNKFLKMLFLLALLVVTTTCRDIFFYFMWTNVCRFYSLKANLHLL